MVDEEYVYNYTGNITPGDIKEIYKILLNDKMEVMYKSKKKKFFLLIYQNFLILLNNY